MTVVAALCLAALASPGDSKGYELLKEKGLKGAAGFYVLAEEVELSKGLSDIRTVERNVNLAQRAAAQYDRQRMENEQRIAQLRADNRRLRAQLERSQANVEQYNRLIGMVNNNQEELQTREKEAMEGEGGKD